MAVQNLAPGLLVFGGALTSAEIGQAVDVAQLTGEVFAGAGNPSQAGFDGLRLSSKALGLVPDIRPTQLKSITEPTAAALNGSVKKAIKNVNSFNTDHGFSGFNSLTDVDLFVSTKGVELSTADVLDLASRGELDRLVDRSNAEQLGRVVIITTDGALEVIDGELQQIQ